MKKQLRIYLLGLLWLSISPQITFAMMSSENYSLQKNHLKIEDFQPTRHIDQPPNSSSDKQPIKAKTDESLSFGISQDVIDFGVLAATNPVIRTTTLSITSDTPYTITVSAGEPLRKDAKTIIPDTTCDNGSCSEKLSALWTNTLTYGFGYQTPAFAENEYKQFADITKKESPQIIDQGMEARNENLKITYKVIIPGTQTPGQYANVVTYIATPSF